MAVITLTSKVMPAIFALWEESVHAGNSPRVNYTEYKKIKALFTEGICPRCGDRHNTYGCDSDGDLRCRGCDNYIMNLPDTIKNMIGLIERNSNRGLPEAIEQKVRQLKDGENPISRGREPAKTTTEVVVVEENVNQNNDNIEGGNNMINVNSMFKGFQVGAVQGDAFRLSPMGIAYKTNDGYVVYNSTKSEVTDVTGMVFDMPNMIFAMPVAQKKVRIDDVILHNGEAVVVKEIGESSLTVVYPFASEIKTIMPVRNMFGFNFYTKITALMDMSKMSANEDNPFGNLMPMMMMSQMAGGQGGMNPMMMMAMSGMFGDKKDGEEGTGFPKEMMFAMMMGGMGQGQATNGNTLAPGNPMQDAMAIAMLANSNLF